LDFIRWSSKLILMRLQEGSNPSVPHS
jgi:hypothetical protein